MTVYWCGCVLNCTQQTLSKIAHSLLYTQEWNNMSFWISASAWCDCACQCRVAAHSCHLPCHHLLCTLCSSFLNLHSLCMPLLAASCCKKTISSSPIVTLLPCSCHLSSMNPINSLPSCSPFVFPHLILLSPALYYLLNPILPCLLHLSFVSLFFLLLSFSLLLLFLKSQCDCSVTYLEVLLLLLLTGMVESWLSDVRTREAPMMGAANRELTKHQETLEKREPSNRSPCICVSPELAAKCNKKAFAFDIIYPPFWVLISHTLLHVRS